MPTVLCVDDLPNITKTTTKSTIKTTTLALQTSEAVSETSGIWEISFSLNDLGQAGEKQIVHIKPRKIDALTAITVDN